VAKKCEKLEQQRVAVGPGNAQFMSIRQVSLRRSTSGIDVWCGPLLLLVGGQFSD